MLISIATSFDAKQVDNKLKEIKERLEKIIGYQAEDSFSLREKLAELKSLMEQADNSDDWLAKAEKLEEIQEKVLEITESYQDLLFPSDLDILRFIYGYTDGCVNFLQGAYILNSLQNKNTKEYAKSLEAQALGTELIAKAFGNKYWEFTGKDYENFKRMGNAILDIESQLKLEDWKQEQASFELYRKILRRSASFILRKLEEDKGIYNQEFNVNLEKPSSQDIEATIALMDSWNNEYEQDEIHESLESFKKGIDEERKGGRQLFVK